MQDIHAVEGRPRHLDREIGAAGWGLLLVWCGLALLADVGWGIGLVGIGVIVLAAQALRAASRLEVEGFSVVLGVLFLAGGIWELFGIRVGLVPVVCVAGGLLLLISAARDFRRDRRGPASR